MLARPDATAKLASARQSLARGIRIKAQSQAAEQARQLAEAHGALRADPDVQFDLRPPDPPTPTPEWIKALFEWLGDMFAPLGRLFHWIGSFLPDAPYARILLWLLLAAVAIWLGFLLYLHFFPQHGRGRAGGAIRDAADSDLVPEPAVARAWLDEADALAAEGRYGEAIHHLLIHSIEHIGRKRPQLLRPALTSRDIAATPAIPPAPRLIFARIAAAVERSLFGGRPVDAEEWAACRAAYGDFTQPQGWGR
jgi:hypothetical protein